MQNRLNVSMKMSGEMEAYEDAGYVSDKATFLMRFENRPKKDQSLECSVMIDRMLMFLHRQGFNVQESLALAIECMGCASGGENGDEARVYMGDLYDAAVAVLKRDKDT